MNAETPVERAERDVDYHRLQAEFWDGKLERGEGDRDEALRGFRRHVFALLDAMERHARAMKTELLVGQAEIEELSLRLSVKRRKSIQQRREDIEVARRILQRRDGHPPSQAAIARYLGLTPTRVSQVINQTKWSNP